MAEFWCEHGIETNTWSCAKCTKIFKKQCEFGVMAWRGDGQYKPEYAVDSILYKIEAAATKKADRLNKALEAEGKTSIYVVRMFPKKSTT